GIVASGLADDVGQPVFGIVTVLPAGGVEQVVVALFTDEVGAVIIIPAARPLT
ncbi:hypothetical protein JHU04_004437, partial [Brenneria sp. 4F2]|nr:hypothetical protein [Brenneria bubanii]